TSLRDSMVWESQNGATIQWTAMGDGIVDFKSYMKRFVELCPGVPVHIETISGFPKEVAYFKNDFWKVYPKARASDLAKFVAIAKKGKAIPPHRSPDSQATQEYEKSEIERSIKYCQNVLGLGLKA